MSEKHFLQQVRSLCRLLHYECYHTYRSTRSEPGFPDLVIAGHGRVLFAELKTERGRLTDPQQRWLNTLRECGAEVYLWRPSDWEQIVQILNERRRGTFKRD